MFPKPVQTPYPPIHVGGESDAALRRVARAGAGLAHVQPPARRPRRTARPARRAARRAWPVALGDRDHRLPVLPGADAPRGSTAMPRSGSTPSPPSSSPAVPTTCPPCSTPWRRPWSGRPPSADDLGRPDGRQPTVRRDQRQSQRLGQLDVDRVGQPEVASTGPGPSEQVDDRVPLDRRGRQDDPAGARPSPAGRARPGTAGRAPTGTPRRGAPARARHGRTAAGRRLRRAAHPATRRPSPTRRRPPQPCRVGISARAASSASSTASCVAVRARSARQRRQPRVRRPSRQRRPDRVLRQRGHVEARTPRRLGQLVRHVHVQPGHAHIIHTRPVVAVR